MVGKGVGRTIAAILLMLFLVSIGTVGFANNGEQIVTLGADLSESQKTEMLNYFRVQENDLTILTVTNEEEYLYLQGIVGRDVIGTRAISSVLLEIRAPGTGIEVKTHNITWVTEGMYAAALVTAGVSDVLITAAAPFPVSGTAALTGVVKAFEEITGEELDEENKEAAHEELVILLELGERINDSEQATELMQRAKEEILKNRPLDYEEIKELLRRLSGELDIELTEEQISQLARFLEKFNDLDVDLEQLRDQIISFYEDPVARSLMARILEIITSLLQQIIEALRR